MIEKETLEQAYERDGISAVLDIFADFLKDRFDGYGNEIDVQVSDFWNGIVKQFRHGVKQTQTQVFLIKTNINHVSHKWAQFSHEWGGEFYFNINDANARKDELQNIADTEPGYFDKITFYVEKGVIVHQDF